MHNRPKLPDAETAPPDCKASRPSHIALTMQIVHLKNDVITFDLRLIAAFDRPYLLLVSHLCTSWLGGSLQRHCLFLCSQLLFVVRFFNCPSGQSVVHSQALHCVAWKSSLRRPLKRVEWLNNCFLSSGRAY